MILLENKYNVAIVGCGVIAQTHLEILKRLNNLKVVAVCDNDEKKAITTSKKWKVDRYYTDLDKMLGNEDISILSILTPPSSHSSLAVKAIKNGINVLVEKPLTMSTKESESILSALNGTDLKMTVVYHWLFTKAMLKSLSLIKEHKIGDILHVDVKVLNAWREDPMTSDPNHWSHRLIGGRFGEMLPHPVYVLQALLGDDLHVEKISVSKKGSLSWMPEDELNATLISEKGFGSLYVSFNAPRGVANVDVYGTKEILKIDLVGQTVIQLGPRPIGKFNIAKDYSSIARRLLLLTLQNALEFSLRKQGQYAISRIYTTFVDSIRKDIEPLVTPRMAYNTVRIVEELCNGIRRNKRSA